MRKFIALSLFLALLASCGISRYLQSPYNPATDSNYWNTPPDLSKVTYSGGI